MSNAYNPDFNKNVVMVYTEEPGFTGYKGLDFTKLDSIEDILTGVGGTVPNYYLSGIKENTTSINNKLFITGDQWPAGVQGTIVYQADLSAQFDNVDIGGYAGADISGIYQSLQNGITSKSDRSSTISNNTSSGVNGTILNANINRKELYIQNLNTGILYVKYGSNASDNSFNFILAQNTSLNAGDGGSLSDINYTGIVSASGLSPRYISWERT